MSESTSKPCCPQDCNSKGYDCMAVMDLAMMQNPDDWPHVWVLPLKKPGNKEFATLHCGPIIENGYMLYEGKTMFEDLSGGEFVTREELWEKVIGRGWIVD